MQKSIHQKAIRAAQLSIWGNLLLAVVKGITGILGNSFALIADAIESTTDVVASSFVLMGLKYSTKPADENHPYGHGKIEPLVTFVVVGFLLVSATIIAVESFHNISTPQKTPEPYTLIVLGAIIVIKEFFYRFVNNTGKETGSTSLKADAWHHRSDAITSAIAFVGITISLIFGEGFEKADDWAALFAAGFIAFNGYLIFRPALGEIMDEQLHEDLIVRIRKIAKGTDGVNDTEKCHIRKSGMSYHVDLHLVVDANISVRDGHEIAHRLKDNLKQEIPEIDDVLVHVEPDD